MVKSFLECCELQGLSFEIVYERTYSPADGVISNYEALHPVKMFKFSVGSQDQAENHEKRNIYF